MTVAADTLYLPVPAPPAIRVYAPEARPSRDARQQQSLPQQQLPPQQPRQRVYRIPAEGVMKGMTYGHDGTVEVERTAGMLIDVFA
jgi:hypothetical protein